MDTKQNSLPEPFLAQMRFHPCPCRENLSPAGICFEPDPSLGQGYYWYYEKVGMFAIGVMDLRSKEDYMVEYCPPDFISVNYFDTISAEELAPYKRISANCIRGKVSDGSLFRARYHKGIPIRGVELILMPGYYHDYLETRFPGQFPDPRAAFRSIDGCTDFPELVLLMKQLSRFQGSGMAAHLYYESKVAEALSLIIQRTRLHGESPVQRSLSREDLENLDVVKSYLEHHFASDIRTDQLAVIACMGQTKLRACFKQAYGCTITEFIQNQRLTQGEFLLLNTDFTVSQVAEAVGYHHPGRFASLFRKNIGLYPEEYRRSLR